MHETEDGHFLRSTSIIYFGASTTEPEARRLVSEFDAFATEPSAMSFHRSLRAGDRLRWGMSAGLLLMGLFGFAMFPRGGKVVIDLDTGEIVVETARWFRKPAVDRYRARAIRAVEVTDPVEDSNLARLHFVLDGRKALVLTAPENDVNRVARELREALQELATGNRNGNGDATAGG